MLHTIRSVKFYAMIPKPDGTGQEAKSTFFEVGAKVGQATITELQLEINADFVHVIQRQTGGDVKRFIYKVSDVAGRIEILE